MKESAPKHHAEGAVAGGGDGPMPFGAPAGASPISPSNPNIIIAGIRQFGLAADGSDLRDLEAAFARLSAALTDPKLIAMAREWATVLPTNALEGKIVQGIIVALVALIDAATEKQA